jgi:hypothetical protein
MIKSEPNRGLIDPGSTPLSTDLLEWNLLGNLLQVSGIFVDTAGVEHHLEHEFNLEDGIWALVLGLNTETQSSELRLVAVPNSPQPGFELITMLAGFGTGIKVENGDVVGDIYVLRTQQA